MGARFQRRMALIIRREDVPREAVQPIRFNGGAAREASAEARPTRRRTIGNCCARRREGFGSDLDRDRRGAAHPRRLSRQRSRRAATTSCPAPSMPWASCAPMPMHLGLDGEEAVRRFKLEAEGFEGQRDLTFPVPLAERSIPGGTMLLVALILAICGYGVWYYLSRAAHRPACRPRCRADLSRARAARAGDARGWTRAARRRPTTAPSPATPASPERRLPAPRRVAASGRTDVAPRAAAALRSRQTAPSAPVCRRRRRRLLRATRCVMAPPSVPGSARDTAARRPAARLWRRQRSRPASSCARSPRAGSRCVTPTTCRSSAPAQSRRQLSRAGSVGSLPAPGGAESRTATIDGQPAPSSAAA